MKKKEKEAIAIAIVLLILLLLFWPRGMGGGGQTTSSTTLTSSGSTSTTSGTNISGSGTLSNFVDLSTVYGPAFSVRACLNSLTPSNIALLIVVVINTPWGFQGHTGVAAGTIPVGGCSEVGGGWPILPNGAYGGQLLLVAASNQVAFNPSDPSTYVIISSPLIMPAWSVSGTYNYQSLSASLTATPSTSVALGTPIVITATTTGGIQSFQYRYSWTFGDGSSIIQTGQSVQKLYNNPGTYVATVVITDAIGESITRSITLTVI